MESFEMPSDLLCNVCGKEVEILNNDLSFSRQLHNQSHKKLSDINCLISGSGAKSGIKLDAVQNRSKHFYCTTCNEHFEIVNNDFELSLQLHSQSHKLKESATEIRNKETLGSKDLSSLDKTFHTLSAGLKCHRHFVYELEENSAFCKICDLKVGNFLNISNHLKTKLHEDNTLRSLKQKLPSALYDVMEFVSFFRSYLYCNLCSCKVVLCSNNIYETILNIIAHNSSETHLNYKTNSKSLEENNEVNSVFTDLAKYGNSLNNNKRYIDYKMVPLFKCKLCNMNIVYDENKTRMLNNLTEHLHGSTHIKHYNASLVIEEFELAYIKSDQKHKFAPRKEGVLCSACNILIKEDIDQLLLHVKINNCLEKLNNISDLAEEPFKLSVVSTVSCKPFDQYGNDLQKDQMIKNKASLKTLQAQSSDIISLNKSLELIPQHSSKLKNKSFPKMYVSKILGKILNSLQKDLEICWIKNNKHGQIICTLCNCTITYTTASIKEHLSGLIHRTNREKKKVISSLENIPENLLCGKPENKDTLSTLQVKTSETVLLKELQEFIPQQSGAFKNDLDKKIYSVSENLEQILNSLPKELEIFWIKNNEHGQIMCSLCECTIPPYHDHIKEHLSGIRHGKNRDKKEVYSLFENIPESQQCSKPINEPQMIQNKDSLNTLQVQSSETIALKNSLDLIPQHSVAFKNYIDKNIYSIRENLEQILNSLPKELEIFWIKNNDHGQITCILCKCTITLSNNHIIEHLSGKIHRNNREEKVVNSLFENIPENLQYNKSFIKALADDIIHVFCSKCNIKIFAHHNWLLKHLTEHNILLSPEQSVKVNESELAEPSEKNISTDKTAPLMLTNNELIKTLSLSSTEVGSDASELKCILDVISKQLDTTCITMNEKGNIICLICNCYLHLRENMILDHLSGIKHKKYEKKKVVISLFGNIPENLKANKSVIQELAGDKNHVFCCKCNVKVLAHHDWLIEHLQGTKHNELLDSEQSVNVNKSMLAEPEKSISTDKNFPLMHTNNELIKPLSLSSTEVSSDASELKFILDDISKQFDTSCLTVNEKAEIICIICNCPVHLPKDMIVGHLSGVRHKKNEKKRVVNSLFENIPANLHTNKGKIEVNVSDKDHVFCCRCHVKVVAHHDRLLEHLQGAEHNVLLGPKQSVKSKKSKLRDASEKTYYYSQVYFNN